MFISKARRRFETTQGLIKRAYADTRYGQVHFRFAGKGETLVMLHQSAASSATWEWIMPKVALQYRVIAVDTPGFGMSDPPPVSNPSIADYAQITTAFFDAIGLRRFHLLGHHTGAGIACEVALQRPQRVRSLILNGIAAYNNETTPEKITEGKPRLRNWFFAIPLREDGSHLKEAWDTINEMAYAGDAFQSPYDQRACEIVHHEVLSKLLSHDSSKPVYAALFKYPYYEKLKSLQVPTFIWTGKKDPLFRFHQKAVQSAPKAKSREGDGGTYFTTHLDADYWVQQILDWLNSLKP